VSIQPGDGMAAKRPFTTDVPRSSRGRVLNVVGLELLGIGALCALAGGWSLAMWAHEGHGQADLTLIIGISFVAGFLIAGVVAGFALAWAARADRQAVGVEEPPRIQVWTAVRSALHHRPIP
jgi:hypothetical protein